MSDFKPRRIGINIKRKHQISHELIGEHTLGASFRPAVIKHVILSAHLHIRIRLDKQHLGNI